ncbi:endonuclease/exonuclease/phosphatase family protein [Streptomyces sp. NA02950]|uniref:endonuclease/exonuclease/phosphatase family protein n=1 Tax=Streptomyces sp. NA02950 TaxID=2742137 RepID=UPI001590EAFF|nr:endonuclease/exonuclease/phosphatase family protein [Streptomyces sp. NA02950]QKV97156.1 endonuclease/exonuclease/phosphatase family protein [Streptomyces sp. NA02950]
MTSRAFVVALTAALHGDRLRVDHRYPMTMIAATRPYLTVATAAAAVALAPVRRARSTAALLGLIAGAAVPGLLRRARRRPMAVGSADDLTILASNVLHGRADTSALATLIERARPDFVALSEAGWDFHDKLMPLIDGIGYRAWVSILPGEVDGVGVVLLAGPRAGDIDVTSGPELRYRHLRATGGILGRRSFIAAHTDAPNIVTRVRTWRSDIGYLARWAHEPVTPIIAGDLNATADHARLQELVGPCRSAADGSGQGLVATFPASLPRWAGIHIDHVFVPAATAVTRYELIDVAGSDHRAILTKIRLPTA